jgi:hypothetical protein
LYGAAHAPFTRNIEPVSRLGLPYLLRRLLHTECEPDLAPIPGLLPDIVRACVLHFGAVCAASKGTIHLELRATVHRSVNAPPLEADNRASHAQSTLLPRVFSFH